MKHFFFMFIITLSFILISSPKVYSQKSGKVEYLVYTPRGVNEVKIGTLIYNDSLSIFSSNAVLNGFAEFIFADSLDVKNNKNLTFYGMRKEPYRQLIDLKNRMIQSEQINLDSIYYTVEPAFSFDWKFWPETKNILGYTCSSATSTFRGRHYKVWYTETIPVNFGPWKVHGLPGLILEVHVDDGLFKMAATSVDTTQVYCIEEKELAGSDSILPIQNYVIRRNYYYNSFREMMKSKIPDTYSIVINLNDNLELFL